MPPVLRERRPRPVAPQPGQRAGRRPVARRVVRAEAARIVARRPRDIPGVNNQLRRQAVRQALDRRVNARVPLVVPARRNPARAVVAAQIVPEFFTDVDRFADGRISWVTIRALPPRAGENAPGQEDRALRAIGPMFRRKINNEGRRAINNPLRPFTGFLDATNIRDGSTHFYDVIISLQDLNAEHLAYVLEKLQQSNQDVEIYDVVFKFTLNVVNLNLGGNRNVRKPEKVNVRSGMEKTWEHHVYTDGNGVENHIGCAPFALVVGMNEKFDWQRTPLKAGRLAWELQKSLGWEESIAIADLAKFVEKYPKLKVGILAISRADKVTRFIGKEFDPARAKEDSVYLIYDVIQNHFGATKHPQEFFHHLTGTKYSWCFVCDEKFNPRLGHECPENPVEGKGYAPKRCLKCNVYGKHDCELVTCSNCAQVYPKGNPDGTGNYLHRCPVFKEQTDKKKIYLAGEDEAERGSSACLVWDIESAFEEVETVHEFNIDQWTVDGENKYTGAFTTKEYSQTKHLPIAVSFMDIITGFSQTFTGPDCLDMFIRTVLQYNGGKNICFAHNSSGYDSRLIFDALQKRVEKVTECVMLRGTKFIELSANLGKLKFRDSMLHMPGSLRNLGKSFKLNEEKGFFPYLFCTLENFQADYEGEIPGREFFDLPSSCKSSADLEAFNSWYQTWQGKTWNLKKEILFYLNLDIRVLAGVMRIYHEAAVTLNGVSPVFSPTGPSYVHGVILKQVTEKFGDIPSWKEDANARHKIMEDMTENGWAVQKPSEYNFARGALRGGRTDTRCLLKIMSPEELDAGKFIAYQDMVSMYPAMQVMNAYPIGIPTIMVWDQERFPCLRHQNRRAARCFCKDAFADRSLRLENKIGLPEPTGQEILADPDKWFGIFCISWECPKNIFHPVLVTFNEDENKCLASLRDEDYVQHIATSPEVMRALERGYKIKKLHRFDKYKKAPGLWNESIWNFYIRKMQYSKEQGTREEFEKLVRDYSEKFDEDVGDLISKTDGKWCNDGGRKTICKRDANCGWGKQCQEPNQGHDVVVDFGKKEDELTALDVFQNCSTGAYKWRGSKKLGENKYVYSYQYDDEGSVNLHGFYLPAGLFVPAYGRLALEEQMARLGERVLYHDTDSIVYIYDPTPGVYNIPEGSLLGDWEREDIDRKHGGVVEFIGLAPKTYAMKARDGTTYIKAKGLSLSNATSNIVNFQTMKNLATDYLDFMEEVKEDEDAEVPLNVIKVPQTCFDYRMGGHGIRTRKERKQLTFRPDKNKLKGELRGAVIYPFGHE